jgi:cytochrome c
MRLLHPADDRRPAVHEQVSALDQLGGPEHFLDQTDRTRSSIAGGPWRRGAARLPLPGNPAVCYLPRLGDDGMMTSKISRIIAPVILLFSGPALAQPDTRRGLSLAREHCAQCHAIDNASESPLAAAPPFRDLHLKYAVSDLQRPLTQGPHTKFRFEPSQIEALMAYLKTLGR